jgi:hypothetical protein
MSVLKRIAFYQDRRDEAPNQELARDLARKKDKAGVQEIAANLADKNRNVRSDCLKVLYEIGYLDPGLIAPFAEDFLSLLDDKNNRMVWGAMIGLGTIAELNPGPIWKSIDRVLDAIDEGSVITQVWGIRAVARAAASSAAHIKAVTPRLQGYLKTCVPRDVPTHLESMLPVIQKADWSSWDRVLESRKKGMTVSHLARLKKTLKKIPWM